jgi:nicotinamide riboside kinase
MSQPIKLAIVGASSTGKTTLFSQLQKFYKQKKDIVFVHESARQFFLENPDQIEFTRPVQGKILDLVFENEKKALEHHPKLIITDTSAIETALYTKVNGDEEGATLLLETIRPWIATYNKFLLLNPHDVKFENDSIRKETKAVRDEIHQLILDFYHKEHLPFVFISGTIPERIKRLHDIIHEYVNT